MKDPLQHNLVSILYALKGTLEAHLAFKNEGRFQTDYEAYHHSQKVLKRAYQQANQALQMTKRLRSVFQLNGKNKREVTCVSIQEAWHESLQLLGKEFSLCQTEIIEHIPEQFPLIQCRKYALKEIFYHLAKNALEAVRAQGKLIIRVQMIFSVKEEPLALISLSDTGPGIPQEHLTSLFQPFFTTKTEQGGNGLGLYFTKALVARNRGKISVSSFPDAGTTFTLEFPVASKPA